MTGDRTPEAAMEMHVHNAPGPDDDGPGKNPMENFGEMMGPGHVDQAIRSAIQACWMALPKDRRTVAEVEKQIRRITERALQSLREDAGAFARPR
jgi:hypothetical protein